MAYASQDEIQMAAGGAERFLALTDWDGDLQIDAAVVLEAQQRADGWIDGFLRFRDYTLPLANPSDTIKRIAADEAVYWLRKSRQMVSVEDAAERKEREREMEEFRAGKLMPEASPAKAKIRSSMVAAHGPVTRNGLKGMW